MILTCLHPHVLECHLLSGNNAGKTVFIPCITINADTAELPIAFSRRQCPVRLAFAMTINKSQGQSVTYVGLDLHTPVFSHGQLYVALSHCTLGQWIRVLFPPTENYTDTLNIVYPEALLHS